MIMISSDITCQVWQCVSHIMQIVPGSLTGIDVRAWISNWRYVDLIAYTWPKRVKVNVFLLNGAIGSRLQTREFGICHT